MKKDRMLRRRRGKCRLRGGLWDRDGLNGKENELGRFVGESTLLRLRGRVPSLPEEKFQQVLRHSEYSSTIVKIKSKRMYLLLIL